MPDVSSSRAPTDASAPAPAEPARRGWLFATAAVAAGAAGAWLGWHHRHAADDRAPPAGATGTSDKQQAAAASDTAASPPADALVSADQVTDAFWSLRFDTPNGKPLTLATYKGRPLLLNFWATWCPPCVKEMPELDRFHRAFQAQGGAVVGLAIDGPTPVKAFLAKVGVGFDVALAGFGGAELAQALGNTAGGLPFSVLLDSHGHVRQRKLGATTLRELSVWTATLP